MVKQDFGTVKWCPGRVGSQSLDSRCRNCCVWSRPIRIRDETCSLNVSSYSLLWFCISRELAWGYQSAHEQIRFIEARRVEDSKIAPREANTLLVLHLDVHEIIKAFLAPCCASLDSVRWLGFKPSSLKSLEFCVVETSFFCHGCRTKRNKRGGLRRLRRQCSSSRIAKMAVCGRTSFIIGSQNRLKCWGDGNFLLVMNDLTSSDGDEDEWSSNLGSW